MLRTAADAIVNVSRARMGRYARARHAGASVALSLSLLSGVSTIGAQQADTGRVTVRTDTIKRPTPARPRLLSRMNPPITPRRAFLYSLALPGFGQSRLDRGVSGALFSGVELSALAMLRRSNADLREARRYLGDSLPTTFVVSAGTLRPRDFGANEYTADLVRTRRLHAEDWLAVIAFNHLLSGADAFVSAQLWDVPVRMSALPRGDGSVLFAASVRW